MSEGRYSPLRVFRSFWVVLHKKSFSALVCQSNMPKVAGVSLEPCTMESSKDKISSGVSLGVAMPVCNRIIWKRSGLQIRQPRFDSGRRLHTKYALAAASATFARRKPP